MGSPAARVDCKFSGGALSGAARVDCKFSGAAPGGTAGNPQQLELTVNYRVPRSRGGTAGNPPQLELTVNYRVPRSRVGGSQNVRNLLLEPKWAPVANVRLGKGSVKSIWRGSARWPAPGEALLSTPAARVDCKFSGGALSGQHSWEAQQLELTVNSRVARSREQLELTVNSRVPHLEALLATPSSSS